MNVGRRIARICRHSRMKSSTCFGLFPLVVEPSSGLHGRLGLRRVTPLSNQVVRSGADCGVVGMRDAACILEFSISNRDTEGR